MDKIDSKLEVIGRCGGMKKQMTKQNRHKSNTKKRSNISHSMSLLTIIFLPRRSNIECSSPVGKNWSENGRTAQTNNRLLTIYGH